MNGIKNFVIIVMSVVIFIIMITTCIIGKKTDYLIQNMEESKNMLFLSRQEIFNKINELIKNDSEKVFTFYDQYTKNREVTEYIINTAKVNNIPYNILFAHCWAESRFKINAKNVSNKNGSRDYGLFQLNNRSFPQYSETYLMNPLNNSRIAGGILRENFEKYHSWEEAILAYNCGKPYNCPEMTINYLIKILEYECELNKKIINILY